MKTLYLECNSGISGDMTVAALLVLGADENILLDGLRSLCVHGYEIEISRVGKCGIETCDFNVVLHDGHEHHHEHVHEHHHEHRGIEDIYNIIESSGITKNAKTIAKKIFAIVAEAEAKVHGLPVGEVHFHEVGAVDSIVDIVGAAICFDDLGIGRVISTPLCEGQGTVKCAHGVMPVPAPATLEITSAHGVPLRITQNAGEMVTPTGAAIAAAITDSFETPRIFRVVKTGYGAGKKDFIHAKVLRASIIELLEDDEDGNSDEVLEISCNLDDMTGEQLAHVCGLILKNGALDCWCTPVIMKKGRPGQTLSLLVEPFREREFTRFLFLHTTTIGVRLTPHRRVKMNRNQKQVKTRSGSLEVKEASFGDITKAAVEYESAAKLSDAAGEPIINIYREGEKLL